MLGRSRIWTFKSMMSPDDKAKELLAIARSYDNQSWSIPAVFLALLALELNGLKSISFSNPKVLPILFLATISSGVLLIWFNKNHFQQLRILDVLKKTSGLEDLTNSFSIDSKELTRFIRMEKAAGLRMGEFYIWLGGRSAARWMKGLMTFGLCSNAFMLFLSTYKVLAPLVKSFFLGLC